MGFWQIHVCRAFRISICFLQPSHRSCHESPQLSFLISHYAINSTTPACFIFPSAWQGRSHASFHINFPCHASTTLLSPPCIMAQQTARYQSLNRFGKRFGQIFQTLTFNYFSSINYSGMTTISLKSWKMVQNFKGDGESIFALPKKQQKAAFEYIFSGGNKAGTLRKVAEGTQKISVRGEDRTRDLQITQQSV